jgi:acyl dehydratase
MGRRAHDDAGGALTQAGRKVVTSSLTFTAEDIVRFARDFDPQPFHVR